MQMLVVVAITGTRAATVPMLSVGRDWT